MSTLISSDMKVGFTGSREGLTTEQEVAITNLFIVRAKEFHHGDCIGADTEAHAIAFMQGIKIVIHPPDDPKERSFCICNEYREKKPFPDRNHDIVDETDILIACPATTREVQRSGTWATIRYAEKIKKTILLIYPSGRMFKISEGFGGKS